MSTQHRSFLLASLLPAVLLVSSFAVVQAQKAGSRAASRWSDPATFNGTLSFADNKDLELTTEWVMVHGALEIGTEAKPHTRKATITLTDNVKDEDISGVGGTSDRSDRGIMHLD